MTIPIHKILLFFALIVGTQHVYGVHKIAFTLVNQLIIFEAQIDNTKGKFILDTGSDAIYINAKSSTNTDANLVQSSTLQGVVTVQKYNFELLSFGDYSKKNITAFSTDLSHLERFTSLPLLGIIGTEILKPESIFIDYVHSEIILFGKNDIIDLPQLTNQIPFTFNQDIIWINGRIGDTNYKFILDSGATIHIINQDILQHYPSNFSTTDASVRLATLGTTSEEFYPTFTVNKITIGNKTFEKETFLGQSLENLGQTSKNFGGIISIKKLAPKGILVDFTNKMIRY